MARRLHARLAVDVADAPVAGADQDVGRGVSSGHFARRDRNQRAVGGVAVEQDERRVRRRRGCVDEARVDRRVDEAEQRQGGELRERRRFHVGVAARHHHRDRKPVLPGLFAHAVETDRRPGIGRDFVANEAYRGRRRRRGRAAATDRLVAEPGRRLHHPLARLGRKASPVGVVENQRDRGLGDPRFAGDVDHRRPARRRGRACDGVFGPRAAPFRIGPSAVLVPHRFLEVAAANIISATIC